jgi:general stress protein 26
LARAILEQADAAYLTTVDLGGYPHTRAMFNLRNPAWFPRQAPLFRGHERDLLLYFTTNTSSSKLRHLAENPRASAYYCLVREYDGLLLIGEVEVADDSAIRRAVWNEGWEKYYPGGPDDPDHTVLRLRPRRVEGWHRSRRFEFHLDI